jgi:hypothetical protein
MKILDIPQSGKRGLYVSQGGRYGQISRILAIPANPRTTGQLNVRQHLAAYAMQWRQLEELERLAWINMAKTRQSKARLGQSGPLTGEQFFIQINCNLATMGVTPVTVPPASAAFPALVPSTLEITNVANVIAIKMACATDPTEYTIIRGAPPQSEGIYSCNNFRVLGECPQPTDGKANITSLYTAKFGIPVVGQKLFIRANQMINGYEDIPHQFEAVVPAST